MSPEPVGFTEALEKICTEIVGPDAAAVDRDGAFPARGIQALSAAGLMGAVSAPAVGGLGVGFRGAATIVGRLAQECGSTAMIACMHFCGTAVLEVVRVGFPADEAAALSALHTRNFM
jgi:alkylation response protein AidB-like acyl-CoA dehydrogenase